MLRLTKSEWRWVGLILVGFLVCGVLIVGAFQAGLDHSPECEKRAEAEQSESQALPPAERNQQSTTSTKPQSESPEQKFCYRAHTAEEWIGILTAALAGFTWLLAMATAALWLDAKGNGEKQLKAAAYNLKAAHRQIRLQQDSSRRELRAYVSARAEAERDPAGVAISIKIENSGNSPAVNVRARVTTAYFDPVIPKTFGYFDVYQSEDSDKPTLFVIGPRQHFGLNARVLNAAAIQRLSARVQGRLYAWGWIDYSDVFGDRHRTEFCWEIVGIAEPNGHFSVQCQHGPQHNTVDQQCRRPPLPS